MDRRTFLTAATSAIGFSGRTITAAGAAISKPNILLFMADQFRGDALGCDGNSVIQTPNLDRLAAEGSRFRRAYSSTPTCTPARAALITGMSP